MKKVILAILIIIVAVAAVAAITVFYQGGNLFASGKAIALPNCTISPKYPLNIGGPFVFSGTNYNALCDFDVNYITAAAFVNTSVVNSQHHYIVNKQQSSGSGWFLRINNLNKFEFAIVAPPGGEPNVVSAVSNFTPTANKLYHVAGTWDGKTARLYVNGALVASQTKTLTNLTFNSSKGINPNALPIVVGRISDRASFYWTGLITNVVIYNRALSNAEILNLSNQAPMLGNATNQTCTAGWVTGSFYCVGNDKYGRWTYSNCSVGSKYALTCDYGCLNGSCTGNATNQTCTDSDGGFNYYIRGTCTDANNRSLTDYCVNSSVVREYLCGSAGCEESHNSPFDCSSVGLVCQNGACVNVTQPPANQTPTNETLGNGTVPGNQTLPSCYDRIRNQDESDVDCGGTCARCPAGLKCGVPSDCVSGICLNRVCVSSSGNQTPTNETPGNATIPGNQT